MLHLSPGIRYYLYRSPVSASYSFEKLCGLVLTQMRCNPLKGGVFIFINRSRNSIKLLSWAGDGFAIYYKRLERGTFELPICASEDNTLWVTHEQLARILEGISLKTGHYRQRYQQTG
jgi:transposase